jgi:hypothetical protein
MWPVDALRFLSLCFPAHIKRFDGEIERPFAAKAIDHQGLTGFVSFNEFDLSSYGGGATNNAEDAARRARRERHARKKEKRRGDKRALSKSSRSGDKHRDERHAKKKHRGDKGVASSSSSSSTPEALIYRYVSKVVESSRGQIVAGSSSSHGGDVSRLLKAVRRKAASKVVEDWASKPRGDLPMHAWLNDKRKAKIQELVTRYLQLYSQQQQQQTGAANGAAAASTVPAASHSGYSQLATDPRLVQHQPIYHAVPQQEPATVAASAAPPAAAAPPPAMRGPRFNPSSHQQL